MRLLSLNVKGLGQDLKVHEVMSYLRYEKVHLALLTETHMTPDRLQSLKEAYPDYSFYSNSPCSDSLGVMFIVLDQTRVKECKAYFSDEHGRALGIKCKIEGAKRPTRLLGVYAPNVETENVRFLAGLSSGVAARAHLILGDFNRVEAPIDRNPHRKEDVRVIEAIRGLTVVRGLIDGWRETHENELQYTYTGTGRLMSSSRIDRIYCTTSLFSKSEGWKIHNKPLFTDHSAVSVSLSPTAQIKMGRGQWRMNVKRFDHPRFREPVVAALKSGISKISALWVKSGETFDPVLATSPQETIALFDSMMVEVAAVAKKAQQGIAKAVGSCIRKCQRKVRFLEGQRRSKKTLHKLRSTKAKLRAFEVKDKEDREVLLKAKSISVGPEDAEFWIEKGAVMEDRAVRGLRRPDGKVTRKPKKILKVAKDFYADLFSKVKTIPESQESLLARLPSGNFAGTEGALSVQEVLQAITGWAAGRMPGLDGVPQDFYKRFLAVKKGGFFFLDAAAVVCTTLIETGKYRCKMPESWSEGCIKLIYKKGDVADIANYRPLSMTNTIYKLVTSVILNRLSGPFGNCIGDHQTGFMSGRSIFDNIKLAQALIDRADQTGKPLYIALLDQKKAYDMVDHGFLWKALDRYGVPSSLVQAIRWVYEGAKSKVEVNRYTSDPISLERGVRQGDPLSCLLFNAVIEPLALRIKSCKRLPGWTDREGRVHKVSMYADDTAVVLTRLQEFKVLLRLYALYSQATGGQLNLAKTVIVAAGVAEAPPTWGEVTVKFKEPAIYLGIPIGSQVCTKNFKAALQVKLKGRIARWARKNHSVGTKVLIAKICLFSILWHSMRCLHYTNEELKVFQSLVREYIWTTRRPLSFANTVRPRSEGGIAEMDLFAVRDTLSIYWVRQLRRKKIWAALVTEILTFGMSEGTARKITMPWGQVWLELSGG